MSRSRIEVIFENNLLMAINKPPGLLSIPDRYDQTLPCAYSLLKENQENLFVVHRLDKDTSGILLFAKDAVTHQSLSRLFEHHDMVKIYQCLTESCPAEAEGTIDQGIAHDPAHPGRMKIHPKGKSCITQYKILQRFRHFGYLEVRPKTGRTHQIRVHMAFIGFPLVCDPLYGIRKELGIQDIKRKKIRQSTEESHNLLQRTALHASELHFELNGELFTLQAPVPKDFKATLQQIQKWDA